MSYLYALDFPFKKLLQIVVKFNTPLFYRYFYNHLINYTKTIIRLRLVNIGE